MNVQYDKMLICLYNAVYYKSRYNYGNRNPVYTFILSILKKWRGCIETNAKLFETKNSEKEKIKFKK